MKKTLFVILISCLSLSLSHAQSVFMTVEGVKQGKFKGETMNRKLADRMDVTGYLQELSSPRDLATGQASGKRIHQPLIVLKPAGASSPQFFSAAATNELLKKVVIEVYKTDPSGMEVLAFTITLENAGISNYKQFIGPVQNQQFKPADNGIYDEIRFTFQKITVENKIANTIATDDWTRQ